MKRLAPFSLVFALAACAAPAPFPTTPTSASLPAAPSRAFVVFFQPWSAALDETALGIIANASKAAGASPSSPVTIIGFADTIGSAQANVYLSETRAQVVTDAMAADGVAPTRIRQNALGENGVPNTSEQYERRVLIRVSQ